MRVPVAGAILLTWCLAASAGAQEATPATRGLIVSCGEGRMTVIAGDVPLRTIIQEWARIGGVTLTNPQQLSLAPVTVELRNVPEAEAIDVLLRSLSGYLLRPRAAESGGSSVFARLAVMGPPKMASARAGETPAGLAVPAGDADEPGAEAPDDPSSPPPGVAPSADGAFVPSRAPSGAPPARMPSGPAAVIGQARPGLPAPAPLQNRK